MCPPTLFVKTLENRWMCRRMDRDLWGYLPTWFFVARRGDVVRLLFYSEVVREGEEIGDGMEMG